MRGEAGFPSRGIRGFTACAALLAAAVAMGCDAGGAAPTSTANDPGATSAGGDIVGSVSLELSLGGRRFDTVSYDLSGNGIHKANVIDTSASATASVLVPGLPIGTGYMVQLTAQDYNHALTPCVGSAVFAVSSAVTVPVTVHLTCHEVAAPPPPQVPAVGRAALLVLAGMMVFLGLWRVRSRRQIR